MLFSARGELQRGGAKKVVLCAYREFQRWGAKKVVLCAYREVPERGRQKSRVMCLPVSRFFDDFFGCRFFRFSGFSAICEIRILVHSGRVAGGKFFRGGAL
jgi:hypothetical protein